ncbi:cell division cycle-associated protein 7 [Ricinus communis]|uniref:cell division cycle-associated protein 7 n=1 Tax=Ricinus communis TaxID=3988 RepID=UPI00201A73F3|nr:cell division cycle-associated protein 7 [Ricinus communis]
MVSTRRKRAKNTITDVNINRENEEGEGGIKRKGYEEFRLLRIKENKERMQKLGIIELSLNLKSKVGPVKKTTPTDKKPPDPSVSPRRSTRLKSITPVNYTEITTKTKIEASKDLEIRLREGTKPEIYTEEHEKLLGDCKTDWILSVDGYGKDGKRIYNPERGETCHQCRQKTLGRHTHCSKCNLVQGKFCGDCLYMRYGENVIEVNRNPSWICPGCRGFCNCSLCWKARGWAPTGPIYRKVSKLGFKSVAHYLIQTQREHIYLEDSGVASLDPELRELTVADKASLLTNHDESLDTNEHQDLLSDLQSDDDEVEMEEEEKQV